MDFWPGYTFFMVVIQCCSLTMLEAWYAGFMQEFCIGTVYAIFSVLWKDELVCALLRVLLLSNCFVRDLLTCRYCVFQC